MKSVITTSPKQTIKLGKKFANQLKGGEVIALTGNLGAGKTTLIKGIAQGLGIKKIITSPTFVLMKIYKTPPIPPLVRGGIRGGRCSIANFVHIDCYRVNSAQEILAIGAQEHFKRKDAVVVIEWPERIKKILPKNRIDIKINIIKDNKRIFYINN